MAHKRALRIFGFEVGLDPSWTIVAVLVVWSLSVGLFPRYYPGLGLATYWIMGLVAALGLFSSVVVHELAHSLVARRSGVHMRGITLFLFGGVAQMDHEPRSPGAEFKMAIAGPLTSVLLSAVFWGAYRLAGAAAVPLPVVGVLGYLALINIVLAGFNLIPAFPLDGGRVLHALLWRKRNNERWATHVAGKLGAAFGFALMLVGGLRLVAGDILGGVWMIILGIFLRSMAVGAERRLMLHRALEHETVSRFIRRAPITVGSALPVADFVEHYVYGHRERMFPVVDGDRLVGLVSTDQVKRVPPAEWRGHAVGEIAARPDAENTVEQDAPAESVLQRFEQGKTAKLLVTEGDHLLGTVSKRDVMDFLAVKMELQPEE